RQVQSKLNSRGDTIMAVEAAYSTEGGGTVMSLPAPVQNEVVGHFGYDYKFFDVLDAVSGHYHDFGTADFDREVVHSAGNTIMESKNLADAASVSKYYSDANPDPYIDDAGGFAYSYNAGYNNPL